MTLSQRLKALMEQPSFMRHQKVDEIDQMEAQVSNMEQRIHNFEADLFIARRALVQITEGPDMITSKDGVTFPRDIALQALINMSAGYFRPGNQRSVR